MTAAVRPVYDDRVSIELARRLLGSGAPVESVEAALVLEVDHGVPFVRAFLERFPELTALVERELERSEAPEIHVVRASPELCRALPPGMCERLLAVPVFRDPESGRVDVAAVDALGPHVASEFGFHLQAPVRVLRASLTAVRLALSGLDAGRDASGAERKPKSRRPPAPARPSSTALRPSSRLPSDPPILLVRRPALSGARTPPPPEYAEEPVLNLTRSKPLAAPSFAFERPVEHGVDLIRQAESAEAVAVRLAQAFAPAHALVVVLRGQAFEARATSAGFGPTVPEFSIAVGKNSVFDIAAASGFYLGPLPGTLVHAELRALLKGGPSGEVYVVPILVGGRPVLVLLLSAMGPSLPATRYADRLVAATGQAIERILRARKQRS